MSSDGEHGAHDVEMWERRRGRRKVLGRKSRRERGDQTGERGEKGGGKSGESEMLESRKLSKGEKRYHSLDLGNVG